MFKKFKDALVGILTVSLLTSSVVFAAPAVNTEEVTFAAEGVSADSISINGFTVSPATVSVEVGETATITASATYAGTVSNNAVSGNAVITYTSSDASVATVSANGVVTGVKAGIATITVKADAAYGDVNATEQTKTVSVTVTDGGEEPEEPELTDVAVNPRSVTLDVEGTAEVAVTTTITGGTATIACQSADANVATAAVSDNKVIVTGVGAGETTVTVNATLGATTRSATISVKVNGNEGTDPADEASVKTLTVTPKTAEVEVGKTVELKATATVSGNGTAAITYKSGDDKVATVDNKGVVTGVAAGKTEITVTAAVGKSTKTEKVEITVKNGAVAAKNVKATNGAKVTTTVDGTATLNTAVTKKNAKSVKVADTVVVNGVTYKVTTVGANAFKSVAKTVTSITLPATITKIDKNAFKGLKKLKKITMKVTAPVTVAKNAFKGVDTKKVTITVSKKMSKKDLAKFKKDLKKAGFKGTVKAK